MGKKLILDANQVVLGPIDPEALDNSLGAAEECHCPQCESQRFNPSRDTPLERDSKTAKLFEQRIAKIK